jgi:hypothetical protein
MNESEAGRAVEDRDTPSKRRRACVSVVFQVIECDTWCVMSSVFLGARKGLDGSKLL